MFFKITTGNVRISFSNDLREVHCPYLTRGSLQHPFQFQRYSSTINAHRYSFFVRTVPAWNALCPVSVRADSVALFHSSICYNLIVFFCSIELGQARCKRIFQGSLTLLASFDFATSCPKIKVWCMRSNGILFRWSEAGLIHCKPHLIHFRIIVKIPKHAITLIYALKSARVKSWASEKPRPKHRRQYKSVWVVLTWNIWSFWYF